MSEIVASISDVLCDWCGKRILPGELLIQRPSEQFHIACAAEEADEDDADKWIGD